MPDPTAFDQPPRRAVASMSGEDKVTWYLRYCPRQRLEMRARAASANVKRELRGAGDQVTIHALWVASVDRAGQGKEPDVRAATALA